MRISPSEKHSSAEYVPCHPNTTTLSFKLLLSLCSSIRHHLPLPTPLEIAQRSLCYPPCQCTHTPLWCLPDWVTPFFSVCTITVAETHLRMTLVVHGDGKLQVEAQTKPEYVFVYIGPSCFSVLCRLSHHQANPSKLS